LRFAGGIKWVRVKPDRTGQYPAWAGEETESGKR
jgi:hypothetical protein